MSTTIAKPDLGYRYEFEPHELDAIKACNDEHGFAIVKGMISDAKVEELRASVREHGIPEGGLAQGQSRVVSQFIEESPELLSLLEDEAFMALSRKVVDAEELAVNRSAAIVRAPGSNFVGWHSDFIYNDEGPGGANRVLNRGEWPNGLWFYLNGSRPDRGGLLIIPDSHGLDWEGPEGYILNSDKRTFRPADSDTDGGRTNVADVPGAVPVFTEPNDAIVFAARTFHAAFTNNMNEVRLSCAVVFRPREIKLDYPWELPDRAKEFLAGLPDHLKPYFEGYTSIVKG